jgi:hypothetical protein
MALCRQTLTQNRKTKDYKREPSKNSFRIFRHIVINYSALKAKILTYIHVIVHRNKFLYNKTNQMHQFPKFTLA